MKKGAMVRMIELMNGVIYHNFTWTYLGFSGGHTLYGQISDFIPDCITCIHRIENN